MSHSLGFSKKTLLRNVRIYRRSVGLGPVSCINCLFLTFLCPCLSPFARFLPRVSELHEVVVTPPPFPPHPRPLRLFFTCSASARPSQPPPRAAPCTACSGVGGENASSLSCKPLRTGNQLRRLSVAGLERLCTGAIHAR